MVTGPDFKLNSYDIHTVTPEAVGKKLNQIIRLMISNAPPNMGQNTVTDFKKTMISREPIPNHALVHTVTYRAEGHDDPMPNAVVYTVKLGFVRLMDIRDLMRYLTSADPFAMSYPHKQEDMTGYPDSQHLPPTL